MMIESPIARWAAVGTIVSAVVGAAFFILFEEIRDISGRQAEIRKELATQTQTLHRIENNQSDFKTASDKRFSMRADEHRWIGDKIDNITGVTAMEVGRLKALHEKGQHP